MSSARTGDKSKNQWLTPLWLFDLLDQEFDFDLDAAATDENTLCDKWYTEEEDGLTRPWVAENVFTNPPYSDMAKWVEKGYREAKAGNCTVVLLLAARTDTKAWWNFVRFGEVRFLPGRLKFDHDDDGAKYSAPFPSAVVIFRKGMQEEPKTIYWDVREPKKNA